MGPLPVLTHEYILVNPLQHKISSLSIGEYILKILQSVGDKIAIVNSATKETVTYNDILRDSIKIATALKAKGVGHGDVIGICCENRWEYAPILLGILSCGATCSFINPIYNKDELIHVLSIAKPSKIFVSPFFADKIKEVNSTLHFIKEIIILHDFKSERNIISYKDLLNNNATLATYQFPNINIEETVAFLFCSSGTTGLPKCVELTHKNFQYTIDFISSFLVKDTDAEKKVTLGLIPFFHGFGAIILLLSLMEQMLLVVMVRFDEENFLKSIQEYKITNLFLVPPLVVFLSKHPLVSKYDLSSVRKVLCGAAPLSKATQNLAQKRLKLKSEIQQGYGMTELSLVAVAFQTPKTKTGSAGTIAPGLECKIVNLDCNNFMLAITPRQKIGTFYLVGGHPRCFAAVFSLHHLQWIVDLETGKALPPYKEGEMCFKGPYIMKGYKDNPEATAACFDSQGWFHTGDIAYYDDEGYLFIIDRLKELIKYKGFQVAPAELETLLINHPKIKDAGVIGIPDEMAGELPFAFVVKQPGAKITEEEVKKYIAGKVSPQKRLHGGVRFLEEIPKNPSGKILRRELRAMASKSKL